MALAELIGQYVEGLVCHAKEFELLAGSGKLLKRHWYEEMGKLQRKLMAV